MSNTKSRDMYLPVSLVDVKNLLQYDSASDRKKWRLQDLYANIYNKYFTYICLCPRNRDMISYLLPQLMKYSNNYNNILISHHQMHADHSRSSTHNCSIYYNLFLVVYCHSCLFCEKKQYITIFICNNNVINSLFIFTEHRRSSVLKVTGLMLFLH